MDLDNLTVRQGHATFKQTDGQRDGLMDRWADGRTGRQMDRQTGRTEEEECCEGTERRKLQNFFVADVFKGGSHMNGKCITEVELRDWILCNLRLALSDTRRPSALICQDHEPSGYDSN